MPKMEKNEADVIGAVQVLLDPEIAVDDIPGLVSAMKPEELKPGIAELEEALEFYNNAATHSEPTETQLANDPNAVYVNNPAIANLDLKIRHAEVAKKAIESRIEAENVQ